ncbi:PhzF family phenazine biosynthesis protein [Rugosimonospora africana]|uniref:Epimerase n=1 Tax=Rugosimonospora africana TaxID=556532 RepID=A0A8J3VRD0_9ACTN|nr:PhzF family phenazine biosynthesis protein [Rugosimonospora africana]GIH15999.1 epimerase [Rugosimonospora africana]
MSSIRFFFVDVFAERPLTGNPLTVVPDADELTEEQMRAIAREFNQSETTFLCRPSDPAAAWRLRSFTPRGVEVGGAGHNALGAWLWLDGQGLAGTGPSSRLTQQIGGELLAVEVVRAPGGPVRVVMDQGGLRFGGLVEADPPLATALGLSVADLAGPAQAIATGVSHMHVPLVDREAVDRAEPDSRALAAILAGAAAEGCYLYTLSGGTGDDVAAYARFFNPTVGIVEDPATGTAAGPLAAALVEWARVPAGRPVYLEQGRALGRPSRVRVDVDGGQVRLSGSGIVSGSGELRVR